jgi:hypothetical protein
VPNLSPRSPPEITEQFCRLEEALGQVDVKELAHRDIEHSDLRVVQ